LADKIVSGSYCTGEAGKAANNASSVNALLETAEERRRIEAEGEAERKRKKLAAEQAAEKTNEEIPTYSKTRVGEGEDIELDKKRLRKALDEEKKRKAMGEDEAWMQTKKSKTDVTQEEMEAYRLTRQAYEDPMANYKDPEE